MFKLHRLSLVHQMAVTAAIASLCVFTVLIGLTSHLTERAALAKTEEELHGQIKNISQLLELSHANAVADANKALRRFKDSLGPIRIGAETLAVGRYQLPIVRGGDRILNDNLELLEGLRRQIDADPALLVRAGNEFVRAATLLKDKNGKSTVGTPLPADGPEVKTLLAGKPYAGIVKRNGIYYVSAIEPITDAQGAVVAALAARVNIQGNMDRLFKALGEIKSGTTGYAYVQAPNADPAQTEFVFHPTLTGKKLGEINHPKLLQISGEQAINKEGVAIYDWPHEDGSHGQKMMAFKTLPEWGWIMATGSYIDEFTAESRSLRNTLVALCLSGAVLLALVLSFAARRQLAPIGVLRNALERIGAGDMSVRLPVTDTTSRNELDLMSRALDATAGQVGTLIGEVKRASAAVREVAESVRAGSDNVVSRTTTQFEAAANLASAVEELSVSITHVSDSAAAARDITQLAQQRAESGGDTVREMIGGMGRISTQIDKAGDAVNLLSERSARISNIGKIINDIADQTNLLALNASIEAARAGESGRGFAVVADEVRKLAERTATSTREISSTVSEVQSEADRVVAMIRGVTDEVRNGVRLATDSGTVLETIRNEGDRTTSAVNDIADTTREQSAASQDVARGVEQIAQMAEQNNQITRNTHEQTTVLEHLAAELEAKVSHFRI